jgi:hypothetical protein
MLGGRLPHDYHHIEAMHRRFEADFVNFNYQ